MPDLKETLYFLIDGLEVWETTKNHIPVSLQKGHRMLSRALMEAEVPPPPDYVALLRLLQRPMSDWGLPLIEDPLIDQPIVVPYIGLSAAAKEFKLIYDSPEEAHVKEVLAILKYCRNNEPQRDEQYRSIRLFLITKPVVGLNDLLTFGTTLNDAVLLKSLQNCYEDITEDVGMYRKCPRCGWTLEMRNHQWRCGDEDICGQLESRDQELLGWTNNVPLFRLKSGVYRYTMLPGLAEVRAYENLLQRGYKVTLFPNVDHFDLEVDMGGNYINFDMKDFSSPFTLAKFFNEQEEHRLRKYAGKNIFLVIPQHRIERNPSYVQTLRRLLRPHASRIRIIEEKRIVQMLMEEVNW